MHQKGSNTALLQKIFIAFLLTGLAIAGLYLAGRQVFHQISQSFQTLSQPNQKLNAVNRLFSEMVLSDKSFTDLVAYENATSLNSFLKHSDAIAAYTDSLSLLCAGNDRQTNLIDSIHTLVKLRKKRLLEHFSYRKALSRTNIFEPEIQSLDSLISTDTGKAETTIFTNRETVTTTTFDTIEMESNRKGILNRIFKPKKKTTITVPIEEVIIVEESDTLETEANSDVYEKAQDVMADISKKRVRVQNELQKKETAINRFEKEFKDKVTTLLFAVEGDIIHQTEAVQASTGETLKRNVERVRMILIIFAIASVLLLTLMILDIGRSKKYRRLLEQATLQAERASQSKQALLSNVSHELRTPLQSVIGYAEQLQKEPGNNTYIQAISKASGHLLQVVNEVLDYSSIEAGKVVFGKEDFDAENVIDEVIVLMQPVAVAKGLDLNLENQLTGDLILKGDPFRLKQVLLNLLGNAIKFTESGSVTITSKNQLSENGSLLHFSVADTGRGIPIAEQEKIFERFEQVSNGVGRTMSGTGLGLAITRAIVEAQGGAIWLESAPGKGSVFSFSIPYESGSAFDLSSDHQGVSNKLIIAEIWLLDDDALIRELISLILTKHKITHRLFTLGEELLSELVDYTPGIVLTDISMPGMGGEEVCKRIKSIKPEVTVIAVTARALPLEQHALLSEGFDCVVVKPFSEQELLDAFAVSGKLKVKSANENLQEATVASIIKKATRIEDDESFKKIAKQLSEDTKSDLNELQKAVLQRSAEAQSALFHRMSGRFAQVGFTNLSVSFRTYEKASRNIPIKDMNDLETEWLQIQYLLASIDEYLARELEDKREDL